MQRSDSLTVICLPCLFSLFGILGERDWSSRSSRTVRGSLVTLMARCEARTGLRPRVSECRSPTRDTQCCLPGRRAFGQDPTGTKISGLNTVHGQVVNQSHSSSLPFCVHFSKPVTRSAATLDTGRRAKPYLGGIPTRLSSKHCQVDSGCALLGDYVTGCRYPFAIARRTALLAARPQE